MQHMGDLQPLRQPDFLADQAPVGRYSATRSRWRFAVGSIEVGFDRASEKIQAETPRPARVAPRSDFGRRALILMAIFTGAAVGLAAAGWLWASGGSLPLFGSETVSAAIVDRGEALPGAQRDAAADGPVVIPTRRPAAFLSAVIEEQAPAPAASPARRAVVPIAEAAAITARAPADANAGSGQAPDEAIVRSGNYLLIAPVARAAAQAMASGEAQSWTAGSYHGLVVVGDAEPREGKRCRQGTVLLRDGTEQGRTQRFERCV